MDIGRVLRHERCRSGTTLRALAARVGTSHSTLAAYEANAKTPRADTMLRVLAACGSTLLVVPDGDADFDARRSTGRRLEELLRFTAHFPTARPRPLPDRQFRKIA